MLLAVDSVRTEPDVFDPARRYVIVRMTIRSVDGAEVVVPRNFSLSDHNHVIVPGGDQCWGRSLPPDGAISCEETFVGSWKVTETSLTFDIPDLYWSTTVTVPISN